MIVQLNHDNLVLSVFPDDEHSLEAQWFVMTTGTVLMHVPDDSVLPTPGQRCDRETCTFSDDPVWMSKRDAELAEAASQLALEAKRAAALAEFFEKAGL